MDYATLITEVYTQTNRPDLVAETAAAIRSATLAAHSLNDFDLDEALVVLSCSGAAGLYQINLADVSNHSMYQLASNPGSQYNIVVVTVPTPAPAAPVVRKILNVWACTATGELLGEIRRVPPAEIFDGQGYLTEGYRQVGRALSIRSYIPIEAVAISYLAMPDTGATTYNSWILDAAPYYLVHMAAAAVLGPVVGRVDEANAQQSIARSHLAALYEHIRG